MAGDTEFWTSHDDEACWREGAVASVYARQHGLTLLASQTNADHSRRRRLRHDRQVRRATRGGCASKPCKRRMHTGARFRPASGDDGAAVTGLAAGARTSPRRSSLMHPGCRIEQVFLCRDPVDLLPPR